MVWDKYKRDALHLIVWDPLEIISFFFWSYSRTILKNGGKQELIVFLTF